jgi:hypothetical protein
MSSFGRMTRATALGATIVAGALSVMAPSWAGPLPVDSGALKADGNVVQARWAGGWHGGWRRGGWVPGAIVGGIVAGAAIAADGPYYYDGPYGYDAPYAYGTDYYSYGPYYQPWGGPYYHRGGW